MSGVVCRNVEKLFDTAAGPIKVLKGVDFEANPGELTMLVGPSGCGKTTLISLFAGLLSGATGSIEVFGRDINRMPAGDLVTYRLGSVGFIFQQYNLMAGLSARENAAVPLIVAGRSWEEALPEADRLLQRLGLGEHLEKLPSQLSGGQQQRVAIARGLIHRPRLLLCDEPTAALDKDSGRTVMSLLRDLAVHPDRAAVIVTHDPRVYGFADRIVSMEDGRVTKVETKSVSGFSEHEE
ncbi:MAG: ABC transporter ATP-binding protein [Isosphaeraceae bacterium]|nr:ABC transporter ATP-binding protein [Isosphaeraceae bacterium]